MRGSPFIVRTSFFVPEGKKSVVSFWLKFTKVRKIGGFFLIFDNESCESLSEPYFRNRCSQVLAGIAMIVLERGVNIPFYYSIPEFEKDSGIHSRWKK